MNEQTNAPHSLAGEAAQTEERSGYFDFTSFALDGQYPGNPFAALVEGAHSARDFFMNDTPDLPMPDWPDDPPSGAPTANYLTQVRTLADAFAPRPEVSYIVAGVIPARSLSVIYAPPGQHKTNVGLDLCMAVATGRAWLPSKPPEMAGGRAVNQCGVLWIDIDSGADVLSERAAAFARAYGANIDETPFYWLAFPTPALSAAKGLGGLADLIRARSIGLVVIDNLLRVAGVPDENSSAMDTAMGNLRALVESTGASVLLIHHSRKEIAGQQRAGDSLRGHSSIEAAVDLALRIRRDGDLITLSATKVRRAPVPDFAARWTFEHADDGTTLQECRFFADEPFSVYAANEKLEARRQAILDALGDGEMTFNRLFDVVKGDRKILSADLSGMILGGLIEVNPGARNSKNYRAKVVTGSDSD